MLETEERCGNDDDRGDDGDVADSFGHGGGLPLSHLPTGFLSFPILRVDIL